MSKYKILTAVALLTLHAWTGAQVFNSKFDTKNHPKAKGVWATVRYPTGWQSKEGERPNIVQKFTGDYNGMYVALMLQILDAGAPVEQECSSMSAAEFSETIADKASNQIMLKMQKTKHEDKPGFIYEIQQKIERAGTTNTITNKVMTVCYKNTMVSAWCGPMLIDTQNQRVISTSKQIQQAEPMCFQFFNSLVLMDKY